MLCSFQDLRDKEVVNVKDGCILGCVDDIEIDTCKALVCSIIIFGRPKLFGLLGREDDLIIRWCDIDIIGEDTILVNYDGKRRKIARKEGFLQKFFKN